MMRGLVLLAALLMLAGCALPRPGVQGMNNASAEMAIKSRMLRAEADFGGVDVTVVEGVALLTGHVPDQRTKNEASDIAWSAPNVEEVGNELLIAEDGRRLLGANDQALLAQVRTRLIANDQVRSDRIHLEVYDGTVYLLGRAETAAEAQAAAEAASVTPGVKRVVSFLGERTPAIGLPRSPTPYEPFEPRGAVSGGLFGPTPVGQQPLGEPRGD